MTLTNGQQAALYWARKQRRMKAAKLATSGSLSIANGAANGTVVGTLRMVPTIGKYVYELTDDDGGKFALSGADITKAAALSPGSTTVEVKATDSSGNTFTLSVPITIT